MRLRDIFHIRSIVEERNQLRAANVELTALTEDLKSKYRDAVMECNALRVNHDLDDKKQWMELNQQIEDKKVELSSLLNQCQNANDNLLRLSNLVAEAEEKLVDLDERKTCESHGLFELKYNFSTLRSYKAKLAEVRRQQKTMIKEDTAIKSTGQYTLNNNSNAGKRLVANMQTLALRAFNVECDYVVSNVTPDTYETAKKRIYLAKDEVIKLSRVISVIILDEYVDLKLQELQLICEYQIRKANKQKKK